MFLIIYYSIWRLNAVLFYLELRYSVYHRVDIKFSEFNLISGYFAMEVFGIGQPLKLCSEN